MDRNKDGYITKVKIAFSGLGSNLLKTKTRIRWMFFLPGWTEAGKEEAFNEGGGLGKWQSNLT